MSFGKKIRKFRRNARAISPVIATLLMIAIAVVASLVTYAWVMGYMNFQTEKTGKAIQIQSVTYAAAGTDDVFTVYVQNVGDSDLQIADTNSVFINGVAATVDFVSPTTGAVDKTTTSEIDATTTLGTGVIGVEQITIKVVTEDGTFSQITQQFTIS
jgi:flagellin-like protein